MEEGIGNGRLWLWLEAVHQRGSHWPGRNISNTALDGEEGRFGTSFLRFNLLCGGSTATSSTFLAGLLIVPFCVPETLYS